jgi:hypothetical protein
MRHRRERPQAMAFRGGELRWLLTGTLMLVVLFMLMRNLQQPGALNWLGDMKNQSLDSPLPLGEGQGVRAASAKDSPHPNPLPKGEGTVAAPLPKATGDTDEDRDQAEMAREEFQGITDATLTLGPEEMPIYDRLVFWVQNQPFARLWGRAKKNLAYTYLHDGADKYRGTLVAFDGEIRLVHKAEKNDHGVPLNEVWATAKKRSGDRLYVFMVVDLPKGLAIDRPIDEKARFAGYFVKLQGYHPASSKPGTAPEKSPLLIGRIEWTPSAPTPTENSQEWIWGSAVLGLIVAMFVLRFVFGRTRRRTTVPRGILTPASDAVIPVETWLEHSGFASHDEEKTGGGDTSPANGP